MESGDFWALSGANVILGRPEEIIVAPLRQLIVSANRDEQSSAAAAARATTQRRVNQIRIALVRELSNDDEEEEREGGG